jgi:multiple sugar transport system substrate-binding protein
MQGIPARVTRRETLRVLGLGAASLTLAACGTPTPAAPAQPVGTTTEPAQAAPGKKPSGEIKVWYFPFAPGVEQVYTDFAQRFQQENPGTTVSAELIPNENRYPKMLSAVAAGQAPDVWFMTDDALVRFVEAKALVALDDLVPKAAWDGYDQTLIDIITHHGSRWYLPIDRELPVWMTNKTLLEKAGWDPEKPPATWTELRDVCAMIKTLNLPQTYGWGYNAASVTLNDTFYPLLYQAGGRPISPDGKEPAFNSDAGVEALELVVELFDKGWASQEYMTLLPNQQSAPWFQGRQAVSIQYKQNAITNARTNAPDIKRGIAPVLKHKEQWGFGAMRSLAMSSNTKNKETAAAFMLFLTRADNMLKHNESFGYMPAKTPVANQAYATDPEMAMLRSEMPMTFDEQKHKYGRDMMPLVIPQIQAAVLKQKTPKEALNAAAAAVRDMFAKG